jgi:CheY-like chemotaxis protein
LLNKVNMLKILLVEDDAPLLEVMRCLLESEGYEVCPAVNGKRPLICLVQFSLI